MNISYCEIDKNANLLTRRKFAVSILMKKNYSDIINFDWYGVVEEFLKTFPELFYLVLSAMITPYDAKLYSNVENFIPKLGIIYGILMNSKFSELSLIQRLISLLLVDNICDQKVFDRLNKIGVCMGYNSTINLIEIVGGKFNDKIVDLVRSGKTFRFCGDNINWTVGVHDERSYNKSKMYHAFGSCLIVQNLDFHYLPDIKPQNDASAVPISTFLVSKHDMQEIVNDYVVLIMRVADIHIPFFQKFRDVIPDKISEPCSEKMSFKSEVIPLEVLYENESCYKDCANILDFYENLLTEVHSKANINIDDKSFIIGGDQLTRERFSGVKALRSRHSDVINEWNTL